MFQITINDTVYDLEFTRFEEYSFVDYHTDVIAKNGLPFYHRFYSETSMYEIIEWLQNDSRVLPFKIGDTVEIIEIVYPAKTSTHVIYDTVGTQAKVSKIHNAAVNMKYCVGSFWYAAEELRLVKRD